jgi:hypothetical protein
MLVCGLSLMFVTARQSDCEMEFFEETQWQGATSGAPCHHGFHSFELCGHRLLVSVHQVVWFRLENELGIAELAHFRKIQTCHFRFD